MFAFGLEENYFKNPAEMSDLQLKREYAALHRADREIMLDDEVSDFWKYQIREHAKLVLDEYQTRYNVEFISPFKNLHLI